MTYQRSSPDSGSQGKDLDGTGDAVWPVVTWPVILEAMRSVFVLAGEKNFEAGGAKRPRLLHPSHYLRVQKLGTNSGQKKPSRGRLLCRFSGHRVISAIWAGTDGALRLAGAHRQRILRVAVVGSLWVGPAMPVPSGFNNRL
jgi:hypothetical protein